MVSSACRKQPLIHGDVCWSSWPYVHFVSGPNWAYIQPTHAAVEFCFWLCCEYSTTKKLFEWLICIKRTQGIPVHLLVCLHSVLISLVLSCTSFLHHTMMVCVYRLETTLAPTQWSWFHALLLLMESLAFHPCATPVSRWHLTWTSVSSRSYWFKCG